MVVRDNTLTSRNDAAKDGAAVTHTKLVLSHWGYGVKARATPYPSWQGLSPRSLL